MRRYFLVAAALFVSGTGKPESLRYELRFGATPTSPIGPPVPCAVSTPGHTLCPYLEPDYVPNYESAVPQAIQSCGASFVGFQALTEGAESASFAVAPDRAAAVIGCIRQRLPQADVDAGQPDPCLMPSCMPELIQPPPVPPYLRKPPAVTSPRHHSGS